MSDGTLYITVQQRICEKTGAGWYGRKVGPALSGQ